MCKRRVSKMVCHLIQSDDAFMTYFERFLLYLILQLNTFNKRNIYIDIEFISCSNQNTNHTKTKEKHTNSI